MAALLSVSWAPGNASTNSLEVFEGVDHLHREIGEGVHDLPFTRMIRNASTRFTFVSGNAVTILIVYVRETQ